MGQAKPLDYRGYNITKLFPSGYFETYLDDHFHKADTLEGIKEAIDEHIG